MCDKCGEKFVCSRGFKVHANIEHSELPHRKRAKAKEITVF